MHFIGGVHCSCVHRLFRFVVFLDVLFLYNYIPLCNVLWGKENHIGASAVELFRNTISLTSLNMCKKCTMLIKKR